MFSRRSIEEDVQLDAMQRQWQRGRSSSSLAFFEEAEHDNLLPLPLQAVCASSSQKGQCVPPPQTTCCEGETETEIWELPEPVVVNEPYQVDVPEKGPLKLDASSLGDLPAQYTICAVEPHQFPVIGVYIDKRIVPGFKYKVRPLPSVGQSPNIHKCLFGDRALTLKSIGRGYARRFTFEADKYCLNNNENYFWSDNRPEGYAFEPELISEGDKFTLFDHDGEPHGSVEIIKIEGPQIEILSTSTVKGIEKRASVKFTGKVEYYESGVAKLVPLSGIVICLKPKHKDRAEIVKVVSVTIKKRTYHLVPGLQKVHRRVTVRGQEIQDVPTKYTMSGVEPYEIPVVGTYVDPRIIPGFYYKIRPNDRKEHLFGGKALKLLSIGIGYAKKLTFESDSFVHPDNFLWSDNHPDGLGLEPRAVRKGMKFIIKAGDLIVGEAEVFRDDHPQFEERMEKIKTEKGIAVQKYIHVDVICHIELARVGGGSTENEELLMRVSGLAVVRKEPKATDSYIVRVENIGLDSQLYLIFAQTQTDLVFIPKYH